MRPRYNIKMTDQNGKVSYLTEGPKCNIEFTFSRANALILSAVVEKQFAGYLFEIELV